MKKILVFIVVFFSALTVLAYCSGKEFNVYNYLKRFEVVDSLSQPAFPDFNLLSLNDFTLSKSYYESDTSKIFNDFETITEGKKIYIEYNNIKYHVIDIDYKIIGFHSVMSYKPVSISLNDYNELPDTLKEYFVYKGIENKEGIDLVIFYIENFFGWLLQPIKLIYDFIVYLIEWIIYLFSCVNFISGGLIL